jgi:hypothetical protein
MQPILINGLQLGCLRKAKAQLLLLYQRLREQETLYILYLKFF